MMLFAGAIVETAAVAAGLDVLQELVSVGLEVLPRVALQPVGLGERDALCRGDLEAQRFRFRLCGALLGGRRLVLELLLLGLVAVLVLLDLRLGS
jgi:hypothetical protein